MNLKEYLLSCLAEECAETIKAVMKVERFGMEGVNPLKPSEGTNIEKVETEFLEAIAIYWMLRDEGVFTFGEEKTNSIIANKHQRVSEWLHLYVEEVAIEN